MRLKGLVAVCTTLAAATVTEPVAAQQANAAAGGVADVILTFTASDGTALEGKLSLPAGATVRVPLVFYLHGTGPRNYDIEQL